MFQLRLTIVEALGQMSHIMSTDKLQAELPKLLPAVFSLYKKHQEPFHITQVRARAFIRITLRFYTAAK